MSKIGFGPISDFLRDHQELDKDILGFKKKYPEMKTNRYPQELTKMFEKYIEVYGHAVCMDMGSERKKISKLLYRFLDDLRH